jgi:hypothetical protein
MIKMPICWPNQFPERRNLTALVNEKKTTVQLELMDLTADDKLRQVIAVTIPGGTGPAHGRLIWNRPRCLSSGGAGGKFSQKGRFGCGGSALFL